MQSQSIKLKQELKRERDRTIATLSQVALKQGLSNKLLDVAGVVSFVVNDNEQIVWCNKLFTETLGYTGENVIEYKLSDIIHPKDYKSSMAAYYRDLNNSQSTKHKPDHLVIRFKSKSKDYVPLKLNLSKQIPVDGHLLVIADIIEKEANISYARESEPSKILTTFLHEDKDDEDTFMTSEGEWWQMFEGMDLADVAIHSKDASIWQCRVSTPSKDGQVIMGWHVHPKQAETVLVIDGVLHLQVAKKRFWYKWFGINTNKITHYKDVFIRAGEVHVSNINEPHRVIGSKKPSEYMVLWEPKFKLND